MPSQVPANLHSSDSNSVLDIGFRKQLATARFIGGSSLHTRISLERKRTERSRKPFILMLAKIGDPQRPSSEDFVEKIIETLRTCTRETDVVGWYVRDSVLGVLFTDLAEHNSHQVASDLLRRVQGRLVASLHLEAGQQVHLSFNVYPDRWKHEPLRLPINPLLYPDLVTLVKLSPARVAKRMIDILGSLLALCLSGPLFLIIALAIKVTSQGPVFFRQERLGQHGKPFIFLKFRSMHVNNDLGIHQQWFENFISGRGKPDEVTGSFKTIDDPRVTSIGKLLRRTSLDELPQFINVLRGEMSLVGPRPPIAYEVDRYQVWHRRRVLEAKPGITGLWQVRARSRVTFDEMVRLDITYARTWSLWLDLKILLQTPRAVLRGEGAY